MKILIVYCHPSDQSFTGAVKNEFIRGLKESKHQYHLLDLYACNFDETFSEHEYLREAFYNKNINILNDIKHYQKLINQSDALVFIYPVFWGEAPSKLVGWFQRVWTYGFAYGENRQMQELKKVLMLVTMGGDLEEPIRQKEVAAMKTIMLENRIGDRALKKEMIIFDRMSRDYVNRDNNFNSNLKKVYQIARNF